VAGRADGGESTREGKENNLLVGPLLAGVVVDGDTAGGDLALVLGPGDVGEDNVFREAVTGLESRHCDSSCRGLLNGESVESESDRVEIELR
jgi:hypothetical protein